jgi:hypothetical protein
MLNKISNIALQNNNAKDNLPWTKSIREKSLLPGSTKDSASFSPAMELLKVLEWDIYKMEYPAKNKLNLKFSIQGLEFHTSVNPDTLDTLNVFNYEIYNREVTGNTAAFFRVNFNRFGISNNLEKRKLKGLLELFQKIAVSENDITEEILNENSFLNDLVSGIAENINADLAFINNSLIYFLNKLLKMNFTNERKINPPEENFFILLKVKIKTRDL